MMVESVSGLAKKIGRACENFAPGIETDQDIRPAKSRIYFIEGALAPAALAAPEKVPAH